MNISIGFQSLLALNIKFCLLFLRPKWGWHLNISVTPSDFRPLPHSFVLYDPWTGGSLLSLRLGQPWPCLDLLPLFPLLFGIAFHLQPVLLSYHPIFLRPYHFLKLVSFHGANRTKSASVCLWLLRALYKYLNTIQYNTIQYNTIQYNTIQYNKYNTINTIQYNTIQYNTIQCNTIQYNTIAQRSSGQHPADCAAESLRQIIVFVAKLQRILIPTVVEYAFVTFPTPI